MADPPDRLNSKSLTNGCHDETLWFGLDKAYCFMKIALSEVIETALESCLKRLKPTYSRGQFCPGAIPQTCQQDGPMPPVCAQGSTIATAIRRPARDQKPGRALKIRYAQTFYDLEACQGPSERHFDTILN